MGAKYKTKTQQVRALRSIHQKAFKLFASGVITLPALDKIHGIVERELKKMGAKL